MLLHFVTYIETFVIFITPGHIIHVFIKSFKTATLPLVNIHIVSLLSTEYYFGNEREIKNLLHFKGTIGEKRNSPRPLTVRRFIDSVKKSLIPDITKRVDCHKSVYIHIHRHHLTLRIMKIDLHLFTKQIKFT